VAENNKKRFTFNDDGSKIRANQGHSISVELDLQSQEPPDILYHGTAKRFLDSIMENGLIAGQRNHVHLSDNLETAIMVGKRHGKVEVLIIDTKSMIKDGKKFFLSKNGVWLTDSVEKQYFRIKREF
jgi:putative RNA 2'-phosphotransferase